MLINISPVEEERREISAPQNVVHVQHIGSDSGKDFDSIPAEYKSHFLILLLSLWRLGVD
jgi:hypothetical protein